MNEIERILAATAVPPWSMAKSNMPGNLWVIPLSPVFESRLRLGLDLVLSISKGEATLPRGSRFAKFLSNAFIAGNSVLERRDDDLCCPFGGEAFGQK